MSVADSATQAPSKGRASREDWLTAARDVLVSEGVTQVKILTLSARLGVARSSFYWFFESRADLLAALLQEWEARNTQSIITKCECASETIAEGLCHFFECFIDDTLFDQRLDFAVREWARRDAAVRAKIDAADTQRLGAVISLFRRHGYTADEADARARILYFMQLGYHALEVAEPMTLRMSRLSHYIKGFTGIAPDADLVASFQAKVLK